MSDKEQYPGDLPLGRNVAFPGSYDASLLAAVPRAGARELLGLLPREPLSFLGEDYWRAWEFNWQNLGGMPQAAVLELRVPCDSPALVESKSLKLYLHGFAGTRFAGADLVRERIAGDLAAVIGAPVQVSLLTLRQVQAQGFERVTADSLDQLSVAVPEGPPQDCIPEIPAGALQLQALHTDLFGSLCPVTGQPDWGSVTVVFEGPELDPVQLLRYLLAYRNQADFHESCAERIYLDLWRAGSPAFLSVHCRYTRRGGIDINPYRASAAGNYPAGRLVRQ